MKTELLTIFATFRHYACRTMAVTSSYDALREAIVRGDIAPDARLVESDLSTAFAMSRGAVRTALIRLEQDGLVVREPHRGARVRRVSDEEAVEILQARAVLEGLAVRQAAERVDRAGSARLQSCLARQRELLETGDLLGASDANAELHATLLELSGHATAVRLIDTLNARTVRYQYRTILIPGRPAASVAEHAAVVEAVSAGDATGAEAAMRRHLFNVADAVKRGLLPGGIDRASRGVVVGSAEGSGT
jgi:DNA-binding GntR family transcriptional regulator